MSSWKNMFFSPPSRKSSKPKKHEKSISVSVEVKHGSTKTKSKSTMSRHHDNYTYTTSHQRKGYGRSFPPEQVSYSFDPLMHMAAGFEHFSLGDPGYGSSSKSPLGRVNKRLDSLDSSVQTVQYYVSEMQDSFKTLEEAEKTRQKATEKAERQAELDAKFEAGRKQGEKQGAAKEKAARDEERRLEERIAQAQALARKEVRDEIALEAKRKAEREVREAKKRDEAAEKAPTEALRKPAEAYERYRLAEDLERAREKIEKHDKAAEEVQAQALREAKEVCEKFRMEEKMTKYEEQEKREKEERQKKEKKREEKDAELKRRFEKSSYQDYWPRQEREHEWLHYPQRHHQHRCCDDRACLGPESGRHDEAFARPGHDMHGENTAGRPNARFMPMPIPPLNCDTFGFVVHTQQHYFGLSGAPGRRGWQPGSKFRPDSPFNFDC